MKIYTKTGDKGETGLFGGERRSKASERIAAYGSVDELNAFIGWATAICERGELQGVLVQLQHDLHIIGADLATPMDANQKITRIELERTQRLEKSIDRFEQDLEPLKQFILAGGGELAARLHICRCIARRAEREVVYLQKTEKINEEVVRYLNRLSDLLFVLARWANRMEGIQDVAWDQSR